MGNHLHGVRPWGATAAPEYGPAQRIAAAVIAQAVYDAVRYDADRAVVIAWLTEGEGAAIVRELGFDPAGVVRNIAARRRSGKRVLRNITDK